MLPASVFDDLFLITELKIQIWVPCAEQGLGLSKCMIKQGQYMLEKPRGGSEWCCHLSSLPEQPLLWGHGKGAEHKQFAKTSPVGAITSRPSLFSPLLGLYIAGGGRNGQGRPWALGALALLQFSPNTLVQCSFLRKNKGNVMGWCDTAAG